MPPVGRYKLVSKSDVECLRRPLLVDGYADAERRLQVEAFTVGYIAFSDVEVAVVNHVNVAPALMSMKKDGFVPPFPPMLKRKSVNTGRKNAVLVFLWEK